MNEDDLRILHVSIAAPFEPAYAFTHRPESFARWAAGLGAGLRRTDDGWIADTSDGAVRVRFSAPNAYGVLDHWVKPPRGPEIYVPLRMVAHGVGILVELVLFRQPATTDADFERDAGLVTADLQTLKGLLESGSASLP